MSRRAILGRSLLFAGLAVAPLAALACSACIEDQVAATYDHAVLMRATARQHVVVYAAVDIGPVRQVSAQDIRRTAARSKGVDAASVRVSSEPSALSFALDPKAMSPKEALADMQKHLLPKGAALTLLRVAS